MNCLDYLIGEIVIVNNNSPDDTHEICTQFIHDHPEINVNYVKEHNQGLTHARNRGISEAKAELIAFIDDDAFVRKEYCEQTIRFFNSHLEATVVGGKIVPVYESGEEPKWMTPYLLTLMAAQDLGDSVKSFALNKFPIGANMIFRASIFNEVGLFNPELGRKGDSLEGGEEKDIVFKIRALNKSILYCPTIAVDHIISEQREEMSYIKKMGIGIGISEITRVKQKGIIGVTGKVFQELFKWAASLLLFAKFLIQGTPIKGITLLKFRYWVLHGLLLGKK
jgi:glycosyltransferase involved in cell wall biosynthesis